MIKVRKRRRHGFADDLRIRATISQLREKKKEKRLKRCWLSKVPGDKFSNQTT